MRNMWSEGAAGGERENSRTVGFVRHADERNVGCVYYQRNVGCAYNHERCSAVVCCSVWQCVAGCGSVYHQKNVGCAYHHQKCSAVVCCSVW